MMRAPRPQWILLALAAAGLAACGDSATANTTSQDPSTVRLGYLTNLTHAPALIGVDRGFFQAALPAGTTLQTKTFSAGPAENEALLGGSLDAAFVGPNPAISAFTSTDGRGIRIVAGAASGGAGLVVSPGIAGGNFPADLRGQTLATPQLGNTQDVALRAWLASQGLHTDINGGGDVSIDATSGNAVDLQQFAAHQIAGGWEPEPYLSQYMLGGGRLVVDEASLWPAHAFPTTELVVTRSLLTQHPDIVSDLLRGLVTSLQWIDQNPSLAPTAANTALASITGAKPLSPSVLVLAWSHLHFSVDPLAAALRTDAQHAAQAGLLKNSSLAGIVDLRPLNAILTAAGQPAVDEAGLG
jgi:NitT/TauT family transport system substrate-binding protein